MISLAPIVLFVYKRPKHTIQTIEYLKKNKLAKESDLFIFSEYQKTNEDLADVTAVRTYLKTIEGFKSITIIERPVFFGLAKSVINGISNVFEKHDRVIVLEDDIITSPVFLEYMNEGLEKYEDNKKIFSITGFCYPPGLMEIYNEYKHDVYLLPRASSWGWGTWRDRWYRADWDVRDFNEFSKSEELQKKYDATGGDKSRMLIKQMQGQIDSWAIRWDYTHYKNNAYGLFPVKSLINNIGLDKSGTHTKNLKEYTNEITGFKPTFPININTDSKIVAAYKKIYTKGGYVFKIKKMFQFFLEKIKPTQYRT
ncbi:MAG: sugar transferase [Bacteroidia bacterium]